MKISQIQRHKEARTIRFFSNEGQVRAILAWNACIVNRVNSIVSSRVNKCIWWKRLWTKTIEQSKTDHWIFTEQISLWIFVMPTTKKNRIQWQSSSGWRQIYDRLLFIDNQCRFFRKSIYLLLHGQQPIEKLHSHWSIDSTNQHTFVFSDSDLSISSSSITFFESTQWIVWRSFDNH